MMKRIFKNKSKLRIQINTKNNLTGWAQVFVLARKPDETVKIFPAVVKDVESGLIFFDLTDENDFDDSGWWTLWPEVIFDDDRTSCGMATKFFVYEPGSL